ncbi:NAD(P)H-quinone oxidoreductase [Aquabacterium soli]|uniref:NAD(P)H-quinone oxidoreductase n=2 Tax=Aquabacterium soli TaxID=2493092 RepID=A0A3R8S8Y0_9BURK|nr:NAD(P)H-quinone oxidoreductase [Aquabacterium soli]
MSILEATLPDSMQEITITAPGAPEVLQLRTVPLPRPIEGELLIRVEAAGINRPDVLQRQGKYPPPPGANPAPGLEIAGEVVGAGPGAQGFVLGDKVCALVNGGGYAQYCTVPATQALPWPTGLSAVQAAALPETFFTVWANVFMMGRVKAGDALLVHGGTSGIGTTALMLAREFGVRAFATAGSAEKCEAVRQLGAEPINHREQDFSREVLTATGGRGVDAILDIMGAAYFQRNIATLAMDGRLLVIGFLGGARAEQLDLAAVASRRLTITGSTMRGRTRDEKAVIARELQSMVWPALNAGRCLPLIHATFPLEQAAEAHRLMEGGDHIGKIVLEVAH